MVPMVRFSQGLALGAAFGLCVGCGSSSPSNSGNAGGNGGSPSNGGGPAQQDPNAGGSPSDPGNPTTQKYNPPIMTSTAAELAVQIGRKSNFLIGMGNDLANDHNQDGAFRLGPTLDLHYAYLSAYLNKDGSWGSWKDWNAEGSFINIITDYADAHGVVPMISLYSM